MEKWSEKRINATLQYLANIESQLETWEERLASHTAGKKSARTMVDALKESRERTIETLKLQGAYGDPIPAPEEAAVDFETPPDIEQFMPDIEQVEPETDPILPPDIAQRKERGVGRTYFRQRAAQGEGNLYDE